MTTYYEEYSKVLVSVDCIIFGFDEGELKILIGKRKMDPGRDQWSLYGGFIHDDESVDDAANRVLFQLTGLRNIYMRQVGAFGNVDRDPGERVISIAYYALINVKDYDSNLQEEHGLKWVPVNDLPQMYSDHNTMVAKAHKMMQRKISHEPISFNLLPKLTLLENVEVPLVYAGIPAAQRHATAKAALERVGLGNKLKNLPNQLSGGQQQRVSIARALARGPAVILADEPTGALDSHTSREVLGMLQDLHKQGNTVVLITHDNSIAVQAERIIRLEDGRVVYDGDAHAPEAVVQPNFMMAEPKAGEEGTQA